MNFTLAVFVSGLLLGGGVAIGVMLFAWLHHRHTARIAEMERKAYSDVRFMEVKRVNAEAERQLQIRRRNAATTPTPEEEVQSYEESLRNLNYTEQEIEEMMKGRRRL